MKEMLQLALDTATGRGASYADIRLINHVTEDLSTRNGQVARLIQSETLGFGVRVIVNGAWGFASSELVTKEEIQRVAAQAVEIGRASASVKKEDLRLAPEAPHVDFWQTPFVIDPFSVPLSDKFGLLFELDEILRRDGRIKAAEGNLSFEREHKWLASSEGSLIEQVKLISGGGIEATAVGNGDSQTRTYPASFRGQFKTMGFELINSLRLKENAERVREEAIALLTAPECPQDERDLILHGSQMVLQIHESVGHASELDRVLGMEANYAGTSFATTEKLGEFKYGSPIVNLVADNTVPTGLATLGYDDDGVAAQRWHIVKDGVLQGYMTNRELAHVIDRERSWGSNRAMGFKHLPIIRISNLSLMPGDYEWGQLLNDSDGAIYMENNKSWSIDQRRLNFQFGCECAWDVKGGRLGQLYKNPTYQGITPEFWGNCDAICNHRHWDLWGVVNCGKGQPGQRAAMSHGASPARFRNVTVGVR